MNVSTGEDLAVITEDVITEVQVPLPLVATPGCARPGNEALLVRISSTLPRRFATLARGNDVLAAFHWPNHDDVELRGLRLADGHADGARINWFMRRPRCVRRTPWHLALGLRFPSSGQTRDAALPAPRTRRVEPVLAYTLATAASQFVTTRAESFPRIASGGNHATRRTCRPPSRFHRRCARSRKSSSLLFRYLSSR
jgi:hypothetical protein